MIRLPAEKLAPLLDDIVHWCIDPNFPVANKVFIPFCISQGERLVPSMRRAVKDLIGRRDYLGVSSLLACIVTYWPFEAIRLMQNDLVAIAKMPDVPLEDHNGTALQIIAHAQLPIDAELARRIPQMLERYRVLFEHAPLEVTERLRDLAKQASS